MNKYIDPKANTYTLIKFQSRYGTEQAYEQALFQLKWPGGFQCLNSVRNTISLLYVAAGSLYISALPVAIRYLQSPGLLWKIRSCPKWFLVLYFIAANKDGISAMALAKYIDITLKTAWALLHKIHRTMGKRESIYQLGVTMEMNKAFFDGKAEGKRGRDSENKAEVSVVLQLDAIGRPQFLKMQVIPDAKGETLLAFAEKSIIGGSTIHSDTFRSYNALSSKTAMICRNMTQKVRMNV